MSLVSSSLPYFSLVRSSLVYSREYQKAYCLDSQCASQRGPFNQDFILLQVAMQKTHSNLSTLVHTFLFFFLARTLLVHQPLHLINGVSRSPVTESSKKRIMKTTSQCEFGCCLTFSFVVILTEVMDHTFRKGRISIYSALTSFFYITTGFYLF